MPEIKGYRKLSDEEVWAINDIKALADKVGELVGIMATGPDFDQRWISIGKTDLQKGFMALTRAIAKPESF